MAEYYGILISESKWKKGGTFRVNEMNQIKSRSIIIHHTLHTTQYYEPLGHQTRKVLVMDLLVGEKSWCVIRSTSNLVFTDTNLCVGKTESEMNLFHWNKTTNLTILIFLHAIQLISMYQKYIWLGSHLQFTTKYVINTFLAKKKSETQSLNLVPCMNTNTIR